ncbi:zinc ribbon domain-containing protein [Nonomuraea sp. NPDC050022]|uniref:zinc ribbon domain-containing protein n=1 Tax=Nonomuraea sp. NPDC050022 TaxID=3364358 RepID=UPI0037BAAC90
MSALTATATCTAHAATVEATGEVVAQPLLAQRVAWLSGLVRDVTARIVASRWSVADLDALASGRGLDGRVLPSKGWTAVRRLGWGVGPRPGVYVCDRVLRCAQEQAARLLRLAVHRRAVVAAIVATWPQDADTRTNTEWAALRAVLPGGVSAAEVRNRTRQVRAYLDAHAVFPADLTELEEPPKVAAQVVLAAADRQLLTLQRTGERDVRLRVKLPLAESPTCRGDWAWHVLPLALPSTVAPEAALCTPTVRVSKGRVRIDLPFQISITVAPATGHTVGCGFDWGLNTLLTGTVGELADGRETSEGRVIDNGRVIGDGRPLTSDARGICAKLPRLRAEREYLAAKHAIAVVTVPARGTSKYCPRCGTGTSVLRHCPAPDRLTEKGWAWAYCPACGLSCDRDRAAAERIVSRGLLGQNVTRTHRSTGARTIATVVEGNVARARRPRKPTRAARRARRTRTDLHPRPAARDRSKNCPTPKRPTHTPNNPINNLAGRSASNPADQAMTSSRVPDRRTVPAPPPPGSGQRPAGHAPEPGRHQPYRTGHVRNSHHRTGFHHAKATPVLTLTEHRDSPQQTTPVRVARFLQTTTENSRR